MSSTTRSASYALHFYQSEVDPLLTPVTIDPAHPFPRVLNKALCLALLLRRKRKARRSRPVVLGVVTVPRALPRLIALPSRRAATTTFCCTISSSRRRQRMYRGYECSRARPSASPATAIFICRKKSHATCWRASAPELHNRRKGDAVRLEIESDAGTEIVERLRSEF